MSVKVMGVVFDRFPEGGGLMVLALKLADHAHDDGTHIFPSVDSLAQKTRQSDRTVQRQIEKMVKAGWLIRVSGNKGGRGLSNEYCINPKWLAGEDISFDEKGDILSNPEKDDNLSPKEKGDIDDKKGDIQGEKGDIDDGKGDTAMSPEPSVTNFNHQVTVNAARGGPPSWLPADAWKAFVEMRKKIRKPLTEYAAELAIEKLTELRAEGHDPKAVLDQSTLNSWQGLFALKSDASGQKRAPRINQTPKDYGKSGRL